MPSRAINDKGFVADRTKAQTADDQAEYEFLDLEGGLESPARQLQHFLNSEFQGEQELAVSRWSLRRTMFFIALSCGMFWAVAWVVTRLFLV